MIYEYVFWIFMFGQIVAHFTILKCAVTMYGIFIMESSMAWEKIMSFQVYLHSGIKLANSKVTFENQPLVLQVALGQ